MKPHCMPSYFMTFHDRSKSSDPVARFKNYRQREKRNVNELSQNLFGMRINGMTFHVKNLIRHTALQQLMDIKYFKNNT